MLHFRHHILVLLLLGCASAAFSQSTVVDFKQAANSDRPYAPGDVHWVQSILQRSNSVYYEGMSVPQRVMLANIPSTGNNQHSLTFRHLATKGGVHAYDYLTSYRQALDAALAIGGPSTLVTLNECGSELGPPKNLAALCSAMHAGAFAYTVDIPDAMGTALSHNIAASVQYYENQFGNRTFDMYGDAAIMSPVLTFNGYSKGKDVYAEYTLTWTSAARSILLEFAGHLALGDDVANAGTGIAYGSGYGAGSVSGAPFHFKLDQLDGKALGNQDNQIMGNSVLIKINCAVSGPNPVCVGTQNTYAFAQTSNRKMSYSWSLTGNTSGASIVGSASGQAVTVAAGSTGGEYMLVVAVSDGTQTVNCAYPVVVNGLTVNATSTVIQCAGETSTVVVSAHGGKGPYHGTGTFSRKGGTHSFTVTDAEGCQGITSVSIPEPPPCMITATATPILCNGGTSTVTITATGGTPPYSGTGTFSAMAGSHTFVITDAQNCTATTTVTITEPPLLTATATASPLSCTGGGSTVTVAATGGTPPYTGTGTFNAQAGTHTYTVTDANNCTATTSVTIQGSSQLAASAVATPILCNGGNSTVSVSATGGTPPYSGIGSFTRTAGTYTFTVTDANNCSGTATVTITQPGQLLATANATSILCNGGNSTVTVAATGGTAPYTGTGTFTRTAGTYSFTVTDANGCSATATATITEPSSALVAAYSAGTISCSGGTTPVTVTASGGTPPYSGTGTFNVAAGTHTFTVTDANNCTATTTVSLTQPPLLTAAASAGTISCNGGSTTVTVTAAGGTPPYSGVGSFSYPAGTHTITVTDANNCTATTTVTITQPPQLTAAASATPILCGGGSSTVTVTATGGTAPYSGTGTFTRTPGTYTFTVTDANSCSATTSVTITAGSAVTVSANATPILCNGGTSTVTVVATGGVAPYSGTGTFTLPAGTHSFTVTDANNCSGTTSVTITQPPLLSAAASATPILCNGNNSTVTVTAAGGTPPYSGTGTFSYAAGTHTITVTDANNCTATTTVTITQPPQLTAAASATPILCGGGNSTVTVTAAGGTPPYTGTGTFSVPAGTYSYTVTDANNCTATTTVTITGQSSITVTASATPILCHGGTSTVTVTATGGTPPYAGTGTFSYPAGTHTITVTDANSCSGTTTITITEPPLLDASAFATQILCNGGTATVNVTATGGTPPYTGTGSFSRPAGQWSFTVTDANGCIAVAPVTITEPPLLAASSNATPILCNGGSSTVTVAASGGTPPYTGTGSFSRTAGSYTFTVTDLNGCQATTTVTITEPPLLSAAASATPILCSGGNSTVTVTATGGTPPYSGTGSFTRTAGTWTFTVTDANNCTATASVTITEPGTLAVAASATPILCYGDNSTVTVTASGGTPPYSGTGTYSYPAGTHTITVTDANSCSASITITINQPPQLVADAQATQILCNGDSATVTVTATGGTPPYTGTGTFVRGPGSFTFTVTDANNCSTTASVSIIEPPVLNVSLNTTPILCHGDSATVTVTASGGTPPYSGTGVYRLPAGSFSFTVTDANGCKDSVAVVLTEPPLLTVAASATPILCFGDHSTVTVTASGGTPPYTGTGTFSYGAGTYTIIVSDANNCAASMVLVITQPPPLVAQSNATPILCNGDSALITVTATGGTAPYVGTGTISRGPGTYTFTVTDANGCSDTTSIVIIEPPVLNVTSTATPILCFGDSATITVIATGGTPPYNGNGVFRRPAGTYTFIVFDANGCSDTTTITVTEPPQLFAAASATPILCNGDISTVTVTAWGGTPPYVGTGTFARRGGTWSFTVTDANGCIVVAPLVIPEPPKLVAQSTATRILCNGDSSTVTVFATGGTPPYTGTGTVMRGPGTHIFTVYDANGCSDTTSVVITQPPPLFAASTWTPILCNGDNSTVTVTATGGTQPYTGTGTFSRPAGTWNFTVTDSNGCTAVTTVVITEPPLLVVTGTALPVTCGRDSSTVTITASGGTPPYTGTGTFRRPLGSHTFYVTDANGCTKSVKVTITGPPALVAAVSATPILCNGGSSTVTVTAQGGTPPYSGVGTFTRTAGTYTFVVTDAINCRDSVTITITQPPALNLVCTLGDCEGGWRPITATVTGGTPPYNYYWTPNNGNGPILFVSCHQSGTYTLLVRDANWNANDPNRSSCEATCTITVLAKEGTENVAAQSANDFALFPNYPNPFNPSTTIMYSVAEASHVRLEVINMLGTTVSTLVDGEVSPGVHPATWNGTTDLGVAAPSGSYIYRIHAKSRTSDRQFVSERMMLMLK